MIRPLYCMISQCWACFRVPHGGSRPSGSGFGLKSFGFRVVAWIWALGSEASDPSHDADDRHTLGIRGSRGSCIGGRKRLYLSPLWLWGVGLQTGTLNPKL